MFSYTARKASAVKIYKHWAKSLVRLGRRFGAGLIQSINTTFNTCDESIFLLDQPVATLKIY